MSKPNLNFKINITSAIPNDVENSSWNLIFSLIDLEGNFSGNQVQVGDILFLDTSTEFPGTLTRYKITSVASKNFSVVTCVVVFDDEVSEGSTKPDLGYVIGIDGTLTRPSKFDFDIIADPGSQLLPSKFSVFPFNKNFLDIEKFLSLPGSYDNSKSLIDEVDEKVSSLDVDNLNYTNNSLGEYQSRTLYFVNGGSIKLGDFSINKITVGQTQISKIYLGQNLIKS